MNDGYSREDLQRLHAELDIECGARSKEAQDAARAYSAVARRRNVAHQRLMNATARRGLIRRLLAELDNPDIYTQEAK